MYARRGSVQHVSRFVSVSERLLQSMTPEQISPKESTDEFWKNWLALDVDRAYLAERFAALPKEDCLAQQKPGINGIFAACLECARAAPYNDAAKAHAVEVLSVLVRCILTKSDLAGWEVMELFAGGVNGSDKYFMDFASMIHDILCDEGAPASLRHEVLQLAIIFMCGINQLSPGAYFLRRDLFPAVISIIKSPDTERFTFEALLLLALLANFHKSDAAKLNPYLQRIAETTDKDLLRKVAWAGNYAAAATVKAYQAISDDSPPTMVSTLGSFISSLRPDRALASTPVDPPRELFKNQPIEACLVLLPIFEFLHRCPTFASVLAEPLLPTSDEQPAPPAPPAPSLPHTLISLSSYLLSHATSSSSPRAIAYANLSLHILLVFVERDALMRALCQPSHIPIRLCRQRLPNLPVSSVVRPPVCALLDCCVLWLRHNLHKRLEVSLYLTCIQTCRHVLWWLQKEHIRLEYHWQELWAALLGLLDFLANKIDSLTTTGGLEGLVQQTIQLLDFAICKADVFLPTPQAIHKFIYELVRSANVLHKQSVLLQSLAMPPTSNGTVHEGSPAESLARLLEIVDFYQAKVGDAHIRSANGAIRAVAKEVDQDGIHGVRDLQTDERPPGSGDAVIFLRHAYADGMSLMP